MSSWIPLFLLSFFRLFQASRAPAPDDGADHTRKKLPIVFKDEPRMDTNRDGPPSMTNRARMYLRYRDLDIPTSWVGVLPFTLAPQESVLGCRAAALPCRSCERASCNIGSGTGHFAGNRDVLPISIVGCDASACASLGLTPICCRRRNVPTKSSDV